MHSCYVSQLFGSQSKCMQTLRVANSGFIVVRDTVVVARSQPMVRGFNFPYQIGTEGDNPEIAEVRTCHIPLDFKQWMICEDSALLVCIITGGLPD